MTITSMLPLFFFEKIALTITRYVAIAKVFEKLGVNNTGPLKDRVEQAIKFRNVTYLIVAEAFFYQTTNFLCELHRIFRDTGL